MTIKLAIVGMETFVGSCQGIDILLQSSYEGQQHFSTPGPETLPDIPPGAYLQDFEIDAFELKIPPKDLEQLDPQQLLLLTVLNRAVGQSNSHGLAKLAVIYPDSTIQQSVETLAPVVSVAAGKASHHDELRQQKSITPPQQAHSPMAYKLGKLWGCRSTALTLEPGNDFAFKAIDRAQLMLTAGEVEAVAIGASHLLSGAAVVGDAAFSYDASAKENYPGEGAAAILLKSYEKAIQSGDRIYAVIEATSHCHPSFNSAEMVARRVQQVMQQTGVESTAVDYIELVSSGDASLDNIELTGLAQAYGQEPAELTCAVGSVKSNLGDTGPVADLLGIIHTGLCLYHRYLPPVPQWQSPRQPDLWQNSPFYVATKALPWLVAGPQLSRRAAVNSCYGHLLLSEAHHPCKPNLPTTFLGLFAIAAADQSALMVRLTQLEQQLEATDNLAALAQQISLTDNSQLPYAVVLVGSSKEKLYKEIHRARLGIKQAFAQGQDWKSPGGSYFTARPQGQWGGVAFVYPGAFNSYLGMGQTLFHRFPALFERADRLSSNPLAFFQVQQLYPKSQRRLSRRELEGLEAKLNELPLVLLETGTGFSVLFTEIIHKIFKVKPQSAFGYSMGESTMMYALDVWANADYGSEFVHQSQLFKSRLAGAQNIIQSHWPDASDLRWRSYVLLASPDEVKTCIQQEPYVYLTHINTAQEVVIGGTADACQRVIAALGCESFRSPANLVLHCEAMASAYPDLFALNHVPSLNPSDIRFYTSANNRPLSLDKETIAHHLATGICQPLDFPKLVNQVYADGARIFIELGSGGTCTRWIGEILSQQDHTVVGINRRGTNDYTAIVKVLAQLVSHRVPLDLSPLYAESTPPPKLPQRISLPLSRPSGDNVAREKNAILTVAEITEITEERVSRLFGPDYATVDGYLRRVRLPSPPYQFVSRVTELSGERGNYKTGVVETEYDLPPTPWYAVDGQVPIGVCAEAGHGLLLLLSYLGSDFESLGQRSFRLLDLCSEFFAVQPEKLQTLRYRVKITSHVKTTKSLLIFFEGECWADGTRWMRLSGGCAGLFSDEELADGQGIVGQPKAIPAAENPFLPLLNSGKVALNQSEILQLSQGNLAVLGAAYGHDNNPSLRLPPAQLLMVDQVLTLDATGGGAGLGQVTGSKVVTPDDWYFQCHFKNDPTMPGSLMVEGGSQLLQIYLLWLGLQTRTQAATFQPLPDCKVAFQFRGQVTPATGTLHYQVDIVQIGLVPCPFAIANIRVSWGDKVIATIDNLGLQIYGKPVSQPVPKPSVVKPVAFDDQSLKTLAMGRVADCLGPDFAMFDQRRCVRIPNRDFQLVSRVLEVPAERQLKPGAKIITEYDVAPDAWFYQQNNYPHLPYCAHIEIAGQPCIFLGLYLDTPLLSPSEDLYFRNIDGQATVLKEIDLRGKTITDEVELTSAHVLEGTILQSFAYQLSCEGDPFYRGTMVFGYFSDQVLANQSGLDNNQLQPTWYESAGATGETLILQDAAIRQRFYQAPAQRPHGRLATGYFDLLDRAIVVPGGGTHQQGYIYGEKAISSSNWYFPFHFYNDPVMPGALGVETILQAMQLYALHQGIDQGFKSPRFAQALNHAITWKYRGQITPDNQTLYLEVHVSKVQREAGRITLIGDASLWKETMRIYAIQNIALCIQEA